MAPIAVGSHCQDGQGSTGVVISRGNNSAQSGSPVAPSSSAQSSRQHPATSPHESVTVDIGSVISQLGRVSSCHQENRSIQLIRVIAVFGADDDGGRATATLPRQTRQGPHPTLVLRPYRPLAPYLASAAGEDYVMEWIRRTNRILANSNAPFRLSEPDVAYDLVRDTAINTQATAAQWQYSQDFFRAKVMGTPDPLYAGRLILHFPWGVGTAAQGPRGSGASDINSWFVAMPSRVFGGTMWESQEIWGWYMMPHEFGHFLGLQHTFVWPAQELLEAMAMGYRGAQVAMNDKGGSYYPFTSNGSPGIYALQPSSPELDADWQFVGTTLQSSPVPDTDTQGFSRSLQIGADATFDYTVDGVADTPADLGLGWAPTRQHVDPCSPQSVTMFGAPYSNLTNRTNPMSYTLCATQGMRYTPGQVAVMETSLQYPHRAYFVTQVQRSVDVCTATASRMAN